MAARGIDDCGVAVLWCEPAHVGQAVECVEFHIVAIFQPAAVISLQRQNTVDHLLWIWKTPPVMLVDGPYMRPTAQWFERASV
jgi:hypothetical protein